MVQSVGDEAWQAAKRGLRGCSSSINTAHHTTTHRHGYSKVSRAARLALWNTETSGRPQQQQSSFLTCCCHRGRCNPWVCTGFHLNANTSRHLDSSKSDGGWAFFRSKVLCRSRQASTNLDDLTNAAPHPLRTPSMAGKRTDMASPSRYQLGRYLLLFVSLATFSTIIDKTQSVRPWRRDSLHNVLEPFQPSSLSHHQTTRPMRLLL